MMQMIKVVYKYPEDSVAYLPTLTEALNWVNFKCIMNRASPMDYYVDHFLGFVLNRIDEYILATFEFVEIEEK